MTEYDILKAEHDIFCEAQDWVTTADLAHTTLEHLLGINTLAEELLRRIADGATEKS